LISINTADAGLITLAACPFRAHRLTDETSMAKTSTGTTAFATPDDITGVLGDIDPADMLAIMSLRPTIADIEEASVWLEGDPDVFGAGKAVGSVASEIIAILTEDEEGEPPRAR
jgi:hypothetical protein